MKVKKLSLKAYANSSSNTDQRLLKNVVNNLALSLQDLTTNFRKNQNIYLKSKKNRIDLKFSNLFNVYFEPEIQSRKERSNMLFDTSQYLPSSALMAEENYLEEEVSLLRT